MLGQRQADDDVAEGFVARGGVDAQREGEFLTGHHAVAVAGGTHHQIGRGGLVLVHALADLHAELLHRFAGVQVGEVDGQRVAAAVVDHVAEQQHIAVVVVVGVGLFFGLAGLAVAHALQAGGVGVVVALKQLADLAGAGVGEHRGVDAGGDLLRFDVVPRRGMIHHLQDDVDAVADVDGGDLAAGRVGDGVADDVHAVGRGRRAAVVGHGRRRGGSAVPGGHILGQGGQGQRAGQRQRSQNRKHTFEHLGPPKK